MTPPNSKAICKTCGAEGPPWNHRPTPLAPNHGLEDHPNKPGKSGSKVQDGMECTNQAPEDEEWTAHIKLLNEYTDPDRYLRQIIQYARSGPFYPADMHVDLIKQVFAPQPKPPVADFKSYFEANLLDGDKIGDNGGAMLRADYVFEVLSEFLTEAVREARVEMAKQLLEKKRQVVEERQRRDLEAGFYAVRAKDIDHIYWKETGESLL